MRFITAEVVKGNYSVTPDAAVGPSREREQVGRSCLLIRRLDRALGSIWPVRLGGGICSSQFLPPFNVLISSDYVLAGGGPENVFYFPGLHKTDWAIGFGC